jgi:chromosome partitioning protein
MNEPLPPAPVPSPAAPAPERRAAAGTRVVAVANQKGGVGKTTTVINLSACLGATGHRVLVVDLDPQCNATSGLGLPREAGGSVYRALVGDTSAEGLVKPTTTRGVDMLPSELDLAGAEVDVARMDGYLHRFARVLAPLREAGRYDFVLVDCPPSLGILTMNALAAADGTLIPLQCEYYALEGLSVIVRLIRQLRDSGANPRLDIEGIVMTMYDGRTKLSAEVVEEVRKHFDEQTYRTVIPRNVRLTEAPSFGTSILDYDAHCPGAVAYRHLAREFAARARRRGAAASAAAPPTPSPAPAPQGEAPAG